MVTCAFSIAEASPCVRNIRVDGNVTSIELQGMGRSLLMSDKRSKSTYKCEVKREDETLTTGIMYLPRALPNGLPGQVLGY
jgi:hypothetical protein